MTRLRLVPLCLFVCLAAAPARAQNRVDMQLFAELRMLHEEVQRLQLSVNAVGDQIKATNARIDAQIEDTRKGFANQAVAIGEIRTSARTLGERENESAVNISRLSGEMKAIRDGLVMQNNMLNNIISLLQTPPDPNAITEPTPPGTPPTAPTQSGIPPSPSSYYNAAFGFYAATKFDDAIQMAQEALKRFPDSPDAPRAQMTIGESHMQLGQYKEALAAFTAVINNYRTSDQVPDAYYKQGLAYQQLGQRDAARKSYQYVITNYPSSTARVLAEQALKKIG